MRGDSYKTWLVRSVLALCLAASFGYVPFHLYTRSGLARYLERRGQLDTLRQLNARMRADNQRLAREVDALRSDLSAVERVVRTDLGWVRPGDVVFDLEGGQ